MPAVSKSQQRLMAAAEHGAEFPKAKQLRESMSMRQLSDFASTKTKTLPNKVTSAKPKAPPKGVVKPPTFSQEAQLTKSSY
jgi:hypothetical protein